MRRFSARLLPAALATTGWWACTSQPVQSVGETPELDATSDAATSTFDAADAAPSFYDEAEQAPLALADLSILFPLPERADDLWPAHAVGARGALLPASLTLPRLSLASDYVDAATEYPALRVVALRLLPCFREGGTSAPCQPQIRLVLQPLEPGDRGVRMADAALHAFYDVTAAELRDLAERIRGARVQSRLAIDRTKLVVHPVLESEGPAGRFGTTLREAVLAVVGAQNLVRVTALALGSKNNDWSFLSFAVHDGALVPMPLPQTPDATHAQSLVSDGMGGHLQLAVDPVGTLEDTLEPVYRAGFSVDPAVAQLVYPRVLRIENPRTHDTGTVDCVSCHVAPGVRRFLDAQVPGLDRNEAFRSDIAYQVDDEAYVDTSIVHMFSYRARNPLVSPRVVHETVLALEQLLSTR